MEFDKIMNTDTFLEKVDKISKSMKDVKEIFVDKGINLKNVIKEWVENQVIKKENE